MNVEVGRVPTLSIGVEEYISRDVRVNSQLVK
jgi:hypothetical protein